MTVTEFDLRFTDPDLADALAKATPPKGFKIVASPPEINASEGANIIFRIAVHLPNALSIDGSVTIPVSPAIIVVSGWAAIHLTKMLKNRTSKKAHINNDEILVSEENIIRVVQKQIAAQVAREKQWADDHDNTGKGAPARRTLTVLFSDIKGYSTLTDQDEAETHKLLKEHNAVMNPCIAAHGGNLVKIMGDSYMVWFPSALEGVRCALHMQDELAALNRRKGIEIQVRIGINTGDVIVGDNGDLYGATVNAAKRIEGVAHPGGVCISDSVNQNIAPSERKGFFLQDTGDLSLKGIVGSVRCWHVSKHDQTNELKIPDTPTSTATRIDLEFNLDCSPAIPDSIIEGIADDLTYHAKNGLVPPANVIVSKLRELREELATLQRKQSLSLSEKRERLRVFDAVKELGESERQIVKALCILFNEETLKWIDSLGTVDGVALCLKGYVNWLHALISPDESTRFDIWRRDFPDLNVAIWLSSEELAQVMSKFQYTDVRALTLGGHFVSDFAPKTIVSKVYPRIIFEMSNRTKAYSGREIKKLFNVMNWEMGLG